MNDDEFFSQFPITPRPKFVESSRATFSELVSSGEIDGSHEGESMMEAAPFSIASQSLPQGRPHVRRWRAIPFVAALLLVLFLGAALAINANQMETALPLVTIGAPAIPVITKENASYLHHVAEIGKGRVYEAIWSPDGKWLVMPGSSGLWVYDAKDLTSPVDHLYPELSLSSPLVFSGNGRYLAFVNDTQVYMWDLVERKDIPSERLGVKPAWAVALNEDGHLMAVASQNGAILVYDTQANVQLGEFSIPYPYPAFILQIAFNAEATQLALFGSNRQIFLYEDPSATWISPSVTAPMGSQVKVSQLGNDAEGQIQTLTYSPDGSRLGARIGKFVIVWDTNTLKEVTRFEIKPLVPSMSDGGVVRASRGDLTFSADGRQLVTVDEQVRLWTLADGISSTLFKRTSDGSYPGILSAHFNLDWTQLAVVMSDSEVQIRDVASAQLTDSITDYMLGFVYDVAFSPDGSHLASAGGLQQLLLWNISDLARIPKPSLLLEPYQNPNSGIRRQNVTFSPNNQFVATFRQNSERNIQLWNYDVTSAGTWLDNATVQDELINDDWSSFRSSLTYSADGTRLLSMSAGSTLLRLWDTTTGDVLRYFMSAETEEITFGTLSPDGRFVAAAIKTQMDNAPASSVIIIYDAATGDPIHTLTGHKGKITNLVYSPDGMSFASFSVDGSIFLWNLEAGEISNQRLHGWGGETLAFSPDSRLLVGVTIDDKHLTVWDMITGTVVARLPEADVIQSLAFSADGKRLAAGLSNGTIQIWGLEQPR